MITELRSEQDGFAPLDVFIFVSCIEYNQLLIISVFPAQRGEEGDDFDALGNKWKVEDQKTMFLFLSTN